MTALLIRAEILKLSRQRGLFFFGFLLVPLFSTFLSFALGGSVLPDDGRAAIPLFHSLTRALTIGGNPIAQLFFALGAASIFTVDYRYSGWRHIVPRCKRAHLLGSKIAAFTLFAGLSLVLVAAGDVCANLVVALARGMKPVVTDTEIPYMFRSLLSFLISFVELCALSGIVAAIATMTRSMMAAVLAPFLMSLVATSAEAYFGHAVTAVPLPTFAADAIRLGLGEGGFAPGAAMGALVLASWCVIAFGVAIAIFQCQDLVAE
jgi:vacuolar-type H+-ATPase subunit I/STV1